VEFKAAASAVGVCSLMNSSIRLDAPIYWIEEPVRKSGDFCTGCCRIGNSLAIGVALPAELHY